MSELRLQCPYAFNEECKEELLTYIITNGRNWRSKLSTEWMQGKDTLRWLRNTVGPSGLRKIKVK